MKKVYTPLSLMFVCSILLFFMVFSGGHLQAQCTTPPDQALSSTPASLLCNGNVTVALASSQVDVNYYLRNDANNNVLSGPYSGTGGPMNLVAGNISSNTTFNINAVRVTQGLYFDGTDDQVVINNGMSTAGDFTWEAWFKTGNALGGTIMSVGQPSGNYTTGGKALFIRYNRLSFDCYGIGYMEMPSHLSGVIDNNWHHVTITNKANYSGNLDKTSMYLDGQLVLIKSDWDITSSQNTGMVNRLGYNTSDFPQYPLYNGMLDDVKFWSTERTYNEVIADMSACPAGGTTALEAFYRFEDAGGTTTIADNGSGTHTGTPVNNPFPLFYGGRDACGTCTLQMTTKPSVTIGTITAQSAAAATTSFCASGSTSITTAGSETNVNYYMSNSTNTTVTGPVAGTGSGLNIATGSINSTTTYTITGKGFSGALNFDGVDDIVSVNETPALAQFSTTPMTMEAWVYPTNISTIRSVIRKEGSYNLYLNNGRIYFEMYRNTGGGTNYTITLGQTILPVNQWSHIAASWQGGIYADIFLNGNQEIIGGGSSTNNNVAPLSIGRTSTSNQPFAGKLDDIRIWNVARTGAQIKANMRACLTGGEAGLLLNYKFDDTGTNIIDAAGGDNNGTLLNANPSTVFTSGVDNCGCTMTMTPSPTVTIYATPVISVNNATICSGNSAVITPTGAGAGATYNITGGSFTVSPGSNTTYSVTGTSSVGCVASNTAVSSVSVNTSPTVSATSGTICSGQSFNIVPSGANSYTITGGTFNVSPSVTTSYSVTGASNGCTSSNTFVTTIVVNASPTITVNNPTICSGNSAIITPNGADTYTITGGTYTVNPSSTASYSVTGTSSVGCVATNTAVSTVSVNATPFITVNSATICSGSSVAIVPGGASTYSITGGSFNVSPSSTTSYSVTGTASNGCIGSNTAVSTVSVNALPVVTASTTNSVICNGATTTLNGGGATTYTWTGGVTNGVSFNPSSTNTYTVTGTNTLTGCTSTNTAVQSITVNALPVVSASTTNSVICNGASATLNGGGATTYTWTGGVTNGVAFNPSSTNTYTVTGTNTLTGCTSTNTAVQSITVNALPVVTASTTNSVICNGASTTLNGGGATTYTWTGGVTNGVAFNPSSTNTYSVTGTSTLTGCTSTNTAVQSITVNALPVVTANTTNSVICNGASTTLNGGGATTYTWTGGVTNGVAFNPSSTNTYTVTGTLASTGCTNTAVRSITVNALPVVTASTTNSVICNGASTTLNGGGATTYTWTGGVTNGVAFNPSSTNTYSVTGTSTLTGCTSTNTAVQSITVNALPVVTASTTNSVICNGASTTLNGGGATTYTWTGGVTNGVAFNPSSTNTYTVTGTLASTGCTNTAVRSITVNALPVVTASTTNSVICNGASTTLNGGGATTYTWTGGVTNGVAFNPSSTNTYSVTGTSTLTGCTSTNTAVQSITVNALPVVTASTTNSVICNGASTTLNGGGATTYTWAGGVTNGVAFSPTITNTYSVTGADANGCENTATQVITVNNLPTVTASASNSVICDGAATTLNGGGATTYIWTGGVTDGAAFSPTITNTYSVTGTDANGCENTATQVVTVNNLPTVAVNSGSICAGESFTMTPSGAATYSYSNGTDVITPASTDSYTVSGTDGNGCVNSAISTVTVNTLPTVSVISASICAGATGTVLASGADTYTWSTGSNGNEIIDSPVATTVYTVSGTSIEGCSGAESTATITVGAAPSIVVNSESVCAGNSATLTANGVTTYTWSTGENTNTIIVTPTTNTVYTVTGDLTGCGVSANSSSTVTVNSLPAITVNSGVICAGQSFTIIPGGASTYTISGGTDVVSPAADATYSVSGTDANGCVSSTDAVSSVTVNALPTIMAMTNNTLLCTGETATLSVTGSATSYTWSTTETTADIAVSPTSTTTYTVEGSDTNNCSNIATITQDVSLCTGIASVNTKNIINVYPNPNNGVFYIELTTDSKVSITNALGQTIVNEEMSTGKHELDIHNQADGIYFVKVTTGSNHQLVKIIKK